MHQSRRPYPVLIAACIAEAIGLSATCHAADEVTPVSATAVSLPMKISAADSRVEQLASLQREWATIRERFPANTPTKANADQLPINLRQARLVQQLEALQRMNFQRQTFEWPERLAARYPAETQEIDASLGTWCSGHCGVGSHACFQLRRQAEQFREKLAADLRQNKPFTAEEHVCFCRLLRGLADLADDHPNLLVAEFRQLQVLVAQRK